MSEIRKQDKKVTLYLGEDRDNRTKVGYELTNTMIIGTSGAGKSTLLNGIITDTIQNYSHNSVGLFLIDPKGYEFNNYNETGRTLRHMEGYAASEEDIIDLLKDIHKLVLTRILSKKHNKKYIIIIDEFQVITDYMPECSSILKKIVTLSKQSEVYVLMASQSVTESSNLSISDFPLRCALRMNSSQADLVNKYIECIAPVNEEQRAGIVYVRDHTKEFDIKRLHFKFRPDTYIRKTLKLYGK